MSTLQTIVSVGLLLSGLGLTVWSCRQFGIAVSRFGRQGIPNWKSESYTVRILFGIMMFGSGLVLGIIFLVVK